MRYIPAFAAVILLVFSSASHIHLRYCLDGDEAPVSVHFESEETHSNDEEAGGLETDKADIETELTLDALLAKVAKLATDSAAILPVEFTFPATNYTHAQVPAKQDLAPRHSARSLPPSRAPPELI